MKANNGYWLIFLIMFLCLTASLHAFGKKEKNAGNAAPVENQQFIKVSGIVRLVGNSPFTELVITGPDAEWFIAADDRAKLHDLQQRAVTVEGIETVTELRFGNGLPAGTRRELRNIRIINTNEE